MKLDKYLTEVNRNYPELDILAEKLAEEFLKEINARTRNIKSEMPYKAQYVLEEIIEHLEDAV